MNNLPEVLYRYIISYVGCVKNTNYRLINKIFYKVGDTCRNIIVFKDLKICKVCDDKDLVEIISVLKRQYDLLGKNIDTLHFSSQNLVKKAKPYVIKYFRPISHECCNGTGIMLVQFYIKKDNYKKENIKKKI